jgi:hypothetical protein
MAIMPATASMVEEAELMDRYSKHVMLNAGGGYDSIKRFFDDIEEFQIKETLKRGIDTRPGNLRKIELRWKSGDGELDLTATNLEFRVRSSVPLRHPESDEPIGRQDTSYWSASKRDAAKFYGWLDANETKVKKMGIRELRSLWNKLKVKYDYH